MYKYKDTYYILRPKNKSGKPTTNKDDNYIPCKKNVQIYHYNADTLAIMFWTNKYTSNRSQLPPFIETEACKSLS